MASSKMGGNKTNHLDLAGRFFATVRAVKYEHLVAGISGGVVSTFLLHPLDLLKIRFAVDDGKRERPKYYSLRHGFRSVFQQEGFTGFYKGVTPNVTGAGAAWGLYFLFYNSIKTEFQKGDTKVQLKPGHHLIAATTSGVATLVLTNPIWVVKTRLCLQYGLAAEGKSPGVGDSAQSKASPQHINKPYKGMLDAFKRIGREEGMRGYYKGFVPGMWGVSHGAIQFMAYEELKSYYNNYKQQPIDSKLGTLEYLFFAAVSKLIAAVTTYPYQVVRARLQDQNSSYTGALNCVRQTFRNEGPRGFYKGLTPNLTRVVPATAITFLVYEKTSAYLKTVRDKYELDDKS